MPVDFKKEVVDLSFKKPVLVDFWAPWCGPCKVLGPLLEDLEKNAKGKWILFKINTEEEVQIASYFKIQSIPHCILIYQGKIVDEFTGAQSKATIEKWLEDNLNALEIGEEEDVEEEGSAADFEAIISQQNQIPDRAFYDTLLKFVEENPEQELAQNAIVKHEIFFNPDQAITRLKTLKDAKLMKFLEEDFEVLKEFLRKDFSKKILIESQLNEIKIKLLEGSHEEAIQNIIASIIKNPTALNGMARKVGIALFHIWGSAYPLTQEYRREFDMAIY